MNTYKPETTPEESAGKIPLERLVIRTPYNLKTDTEVFQAVVTGVKKYEIRFNDRNFQVGDELVLLETLHTGQQMKDGAELVFTGRAITKHISHILEGPVYGLQDGWAILSFAV